MLGNLFAKEFTWCNDSTWLRTGSKIRFGIAESLSIKATDSQIQSAVETSLAGKLDKAMEVHLSEISLKAGSTILTDGTA